MISFCSYYLEKDGPFYEVYDMKRDPYQLDNISKDMDRRRFRALDEILESMRTCSGDECLKLRERPLNY